MSSRLALGRVGLSNEWWIPRSGLYLPVGAGRVRVVSTQPHSSTEESSEERMGDEVKGQGGTADDAPNTGSHAIWWVAAAVAVLAIGAAVFVSGGDAAGPLAWLTGDSSEQSAEPEIPVSQPATGTPPGSARPTAPAPVGSRLATITQPPESTLAMLNADTVSADARVNVTFSPFGYGPPSQGKTVVIRIDEATAVGDIGDLDLNDRNVLAVVGPGEPMPEKGGSYSGVLTFRPEGDLLIPVLSAITAE